MKSEECFYWTEEKVKAIKERYQTDGPQKLAKELGTTHWAVTAKARRLGIGATRKTPPRSFKWTKAMVAAVKVRYVPEGGDRLAQEFGVTLETIRRKASKLGLHTIAGHARAGRERAEASQSCDIHYFDQWSPNMAYILGFLFADGSMNKKRTDIRILISDRDIAVLEFIRRELRAKSKILRYDLKDKRGWNAKPQALLILSSTLLCQQLEKIGLHPRKTYNNDPFPEVPDGMLPHFVRGYLDGDGCVHISKEFCSVSFVGSPRFIAGLQESLTRVVGMQNKRVHTKKGKHADYAEVAWSSNQDVRLFRGFAYPDGFGFCLQRKKQKLDEWLTGDHREQQARRPWTAKERNLLRRHYQGLGPTKIGDLIGRDKGSVHNKAKELGLT